VFLWFVGLAWLAVYVVFQSPALDYRLVALGALIPLGDAATGGAWVLHSLLASVAALAIVMVATRHRRLVRRRWLGIPIGMFMHLVLDGVWTESHVFWWPFFGVSFAGYGLPEAGRSDATLIAMELIGAAALVWGYRRFDMADPHVRRRFLDTGQLPR
jgi:hypothetical protein